MLKPDLHRTVFIFLLASLLLGACSPRLSPQQAGQVFQPVSELHLPNTATLVGIGEATHGNAEFVELRREVLEILVTRYGFRAFAIEGDFGGSQVVNDHVLHGVGTAEEAVRAIGFAIYRTQEMVDLVEWIRQYNLSAAPQEQVHFYGFDMQRYDHNINRLMAYLEQVDPTAVEPYRASLADLNDETVFDQQPDKIKAGLRAIQDIRKEMQDNKAEYVAASSEAEFSIADQFAASIEENATLRSGSVNYAQTRDEYMANKVRWIMEYEQQQGRGRLLIAGHTGHIEKSAAAAQYRSMGNRLSEAFGAQYFAIGAEFIESQFTCKDAASNERRVFSVKNNNRLNRTFAAADLETGYMDVQSALKMDDIRPLVTSRHAMSNIGDSFGAWYAYFSPLFTIKMVPAEAYDAIIFVRNAHPTTMLPD